MERLTQQKKRELLDAALAARERAYAPYSRFAVGAALLASSGRVYPGCNVENAASPATICAERTALAAAVAAGERDFVALAVAGGPAGEPAAACPPCGLCRQVLAELCPPRMPVVTGDERTLSETTVEEMLPFRFGRETLR